MLLDFPIGGNLLVFCLDTRPPTEVYALIAAGNGCENVVCVLKSVYLIMLMGSSCLREEEVFKGGYSRWKLPVIAKSSSFWSSFNKEV